ncbi:MAG: NAD-dependent epimerase/dehydratase family protein [Desulfobacterales bacterium]
MGTAGHGPFLFTKAILEDKPIQVFNHGKMLRDFTYIDDIVEGVVRVIDAVPTPNSEWSGDTPDPGTSYKPYRIFNIGNNNPVELTRFIEAIETALGKEAEKISWTFSPGMWPPRMPILTIYTMPWDLSLKQPSNTAFKIY